MDNNPRANRAVEQLLARRRMTAKVIAGKAFVIKTPVVQTFSKFVVKGLLEGSQGALVYGRPRRGKTMEIRWVLKGIGSARTDRNDRRAKDGSRTRQGACRRCSR